MTTKKTQEIIETLRAKGHRITKAREQILETIVVSKSPLTAQEIILRLAKKNLHPNKTTIYREVQFLRDESVLNEIDLLQGQKRYEIHDPSHHHHHLLCTHCSKITCVGMDNDLDALESKIQKKYRFKVTGHLLEFFGVCSDCARAA